MNGVPGPIPWTAIEAFAVRYHFDDYDAFDDLVTIIGELDAVYHEFMIEQQEKDKD